jgi:hypothetical protein
VWQQIPHRVHDVDCPLRIRYADMDVETEGEERTRDHLILFDHQIVSFILKDLVILPMRERMGAGGRQSPARSCAQG